MANAHPSLFYDLLSLASNEESVKKDYPIIARYVRYPKLWRAFQTAYYDSEGDAKPTFTKIFYGGGIDGDDLPHLLKPGVEVHEAAGRVLNMPRFKVLKREKVYNNRRNPKFSKLAAAMSSVENAKRKDMIAGPSIAPNTRCLMFDGAVVQCANENEMKTRLETMRAGLRGAGNSIYLDLAIKNWPSWRTDSNNENFNPLRQPLEELTSARAADRLEGEVCKVGELSDSWLYDAIGCMRPNAPYKYPTERGPHTCQSFNAVFSGFRRLHT